MYSAHPNFFTFDLVLGMWVALSLVCGLYLLNLFRVGHDEPLESIGVPRLITGFLFLSMAFYLAPALLSLGPDGEKMRPRGSVYAWVDSFLLPDSNEKAGGLPWSGDLKKAIDDALDESQRTGRQKFVFIDFTGETCTNCKLNENDVFTKEEIRQLFGQYKLVQLFTDKVPDKLYPTTVQSRFRGSIEQQEGDALLNRKFQDKAFGTIQLPLYVILKPTPEGPIEIVDTFPEGKINNVNRFAEFLKGPLAVDNAHVSK